MEALMSEKYGGHAFPTSDEQYPGMTLRDWFAGQALAAIMQSKPTLDPEDWTLEAYIIADLMIEERRDD